MVAETTENFIEVISTVAAAEKYQLTPSYVARLARTRTIRARKFGRDWIIDEEALRDYLAQPRKPGPKPREDKKLVERLSDTKGEDHAAAKGYRAKDAIS